MSFKIEEKQIVKEYQTIYLVNGKEFSNKLVAEIYTKHSGNLDSINKRILYFQDIEDSLERQLRDCREEAYLTYEASYMADSK